MRYITRAIALFLLLFTLDIHFSFFLTKLSSILNIFAPFSFVQEPDIAFGERSKQNEHRFVVGTSRLSRLSDVD